MREQELNRVRLQSSDHSMHFILRKYIDSDDKIDTELSAEVHLNPSVSWKSKLWRAIKFITRLGIPCRYGQWDEFILTRTQATDLLSMIKEWASIHIDYHHEWISKKSTISCDGFDEKFSCECYSPEHTLHVMMYEDLFSLHFFVDGRWPGFWTRLLWSIQYVTYGESKPHRDAFILRRIDAERLMSLLMEFINGNSTGSTSIPSSGVDTSQ